MTRYSISAVVACLLVAGMAYAQDTAWVRRYNGPGNFFDGATAIAVDAAGNVYVTGWRASGSTVNTYDYTTIKYKPNGDTAWMRIYAGPGNNADQAWAIAVDAAGNVYVTGGSAGSGTGTDYATIKYNPAGAEQWVARYDGPRPGWPDCAYSIAVDAAGNVYVTGGAMGFTGEDFTTIKYNSAGAEQWVAVYNGPGNNLDNAWALVVDDDGNVYVTGVSRSGWLAGTEDYATVKYDNDGNEQWVARYNGPGDNDDRGLALTRDGSGNVYVTGYSTGSGTGYDYVTIKYKPNGDTAWLRRYDGGANSADQANAIAVDAAGNVYVTGYSTGPGTGTGYGTIKYNTAGEQQWVARYDGVPGGGTSTASAIAVGVVGNVYVTGYSGGSGTGWDYATVRYNSAGAQQWVARYDGPGTSQDRARAIALDANGNVYVTGYSEAGSGSATRDYATIKYNPGVGVEEERTTSYASRTTPGATIVRGVLWIGGGRQNTGYRAVLLDAAGRKAIGLGPGANSVSGLAPGVYFVKSETGDRLDRVVIAR